MTNPIFESTGSWDLLCDVGLGRMIVSKDIHSSHPPSGTQGGPPSLILRTGTLKAEASIGSEDELGRISGRDKEAPRSDYTAKADSADNVFIEDVSAEEITNSERLLLTLFRLSRFLDHYRDQLSLWRNIGSIALCGIRMAFCSVSLPLRRGRTRNNNDRLSRSFIHRRQFSFGKWN